ncbi:MAG: sulfatase family protein [Marinifilaceae bacterium]
MLLKVLVGTSVLSVPFVLKANAQKNDGPLNVVVIMADQWRGDALGYMNREPVRTPNLDRLAKQGVSFHQAVSSYPVSSPARGMFMSGMYPFNSGVPLNCNSDNPGVELHEDAICWSDILKQNGYATGYIGKWHLDMPYAPYIDCANNRGKVKWNEWCPPSRRHGFDEWIAYGTYDAHLNPLYWTKDATRDEYKYVNQWGPEFETDRAIEFINNNKEKPFALMVSMNPPHTGYSLVPERYKTIYKDLDVDALAKEYPNLLTDADKRFFKKHVRDYYACMTGVDENVGRLLDYLEQNGLRENTLIIFTSDHGDMMGMHSVIGKNSPHECAVRIPLIMSLPNVIKPRIDEKTLIALEDLYPTFLSIIGYEDQIPATVQTRNLAKRVMNGKGKTPDCQLYFKMENDEPASPINGWRGIRTEQYTYSCHFVKGKKAEILLFDRETDPRQVNNIANTASEKLLRKMDALLMQELNRIADPVLNTMIN